jgi:hypothetical protein
MAPYRPRPDTPAPYRSPVAGKQSGYCSVLLEGDGDPFPVEKAAGLLRPYLTAAVAFLGNIRVESSDHLTYCPVRWLDHFDGS